MEKYESPTIEQAGGSGGAEPNLFIAILALVAWALAVATAVAVVSYDVFWVQTHTSVD